MKRAIPISILAVLLFPVDQLQAEPGAKVQFNRDIRPILSENCFYCHGQDPETREADLRIDTADGAGEVIVPGDADASELFARLVSHDEDEQMPPPDSNRTVTQEEIERIRRWIEEGAEYETHWSFVPPEKPVSPQVEDAGDWVKDPVDQFVLARLETEGRQPAIATSDDNWLRRITLDMLGLPPTEAQRDAFATALVEDPERAHARTVDAVLASPHYGERLAIDWLDVARYADTHGFNNDTAREMSRWRDWVIRAFNENKPYDEFITEQLAGDLLPEANLEQKIATGFGRNHVINSEGGIIDEEYRVEYVADRVRTLGMAWMGLTLECARCHDHKYDPITQKDYFRFFAFFNNMDEVGEAGRSGNPAPIIQAPTREQRETDRVLADAVALLEQKLDKERTATDLALLEAPPLLQIAPPPTEKKEEKRSGYLHYAEPGEANPPGGLLEDPSEGGEGVIGKGIVCAESAPAPKLDHKTIPTGGGRNMSFAFWVKPDPANPDDAPLMGNAYYEADPEATNLGEGIDIRLIDGDVEFRLSDLYPGYALAVRSDGEKIGAGAWHHVAVSYDASGLPATDRRAYAAWVRIFIDGIEQPIEQLHDGLHKFEETDIGRRPWQIGRDTAKPSRQFVGAIDELIVVSRALGEREVFDEFARGALPLAQAGEARWHARLQARLGKGGDQALARLVDSTRADRIRRQREFPNTMVMAEREGEKRKTHLLVRGTYSAPGEEVTPGVPEGLLGKWPEGEKKDRLGLARWLTQRENPLTSRVVVNRAWQHLFGIGLVKTSEDFGYQAEWPSHPELLDYLAVEFIESGWDLRALYRRLLLSATYRQSSDVGSEHYAADPENRALARGARVRLPGEVIRDQALAVSGLLNPEIGGPSVRPYQPEGVYNGVVVGADYTSTVWHQSAGDDIYRRSLYTFWKRTVPHPAMLTFDVPDREFCSVRRATTNTPLQALNLMNDPTYLEAAGHLAHEILGAKELGDEDIRARLHAAFMRTLGRPPEADELTALTETLAAVRESFSREGADAEAFVKASVPGLATTAPAIDQAAFTTIVSLLLNLDETITKH